MKGLFSYEGPISQWIGRILDYLLLGLLWSLFSVPVVTVGAASVALHHTARKVLRQEMSHVTTEFWHAFKSNLKQGTAVWLILLGIIVFLGIDIYYTLSLWMGGVLHGSVPILLLILAALVLAWGQYLFSYLSYFRDVTGIALKNCLLMVLSNPIASLGLVLLMACGAVVVYDIPGGLLLAAPGIGLFGGKITERVFQKYIPDQEV